MTNWLCVKNLEDGQVCEKYVKQIKIQNKQIGFFCKICNDKREKESFVTVLKTFIGIWHI